MTAAQCTDWFVQEFGGAALGHGARTKRAVQVAGALAQAPTDSIPDACGDWKRTKGAYRLLSNKRVTHAGLLSGHQTETRARCQKHTAVLVIEDTTQLDFTGRKSLVGMGPTGSAGLQGMFAHTAFAVAAHVREPLGILAQHIWARKHVAVSRSKSGESTTQRRHRPDRESTRWPQMVDTIAEVLKTPDNPQSATRYIHVCDREGDIFEMMQQCLAHGHGFVLRALQNRGVITDAQTKERSLDLAATGPILGETTVKVSRQAGRAERDALVTIRSTPIVLKKPQHMPRKQANIAVGIVTIREETPPSDGQDPLLWHLLTTEPCSTLEQALAIKFHYETRWMIEELHMGIKTGCAYEERQFEKRHPFDNLLAIVSVIAWHMLLLRWHARRPEPSPAEAVLSQTQIQLLQHLCPKLPKQFSAYEAMRAIATRGGFLARKGDGEPGWRTLWAGFQELLAIERGFIAAQELAAMVPAQDSG